MASTGNVFPTVGANAARGGATDWVSPGNVVSDNATDTTNPETAGADYLVCSGFGFTIPSGATIAGVTVRVEASETGTGSTNYIPQLMSAATPTLIGAAKSAVTVTGTTKVISTTGGVSDVWSATLTPAIVNDAGFGVALWTTDTGNTLAIDFVTIAIEYTTPLMATITDNFQDGSLSSVWTATDDADITRLEASGRLRFTAHETGTGTAYVQTLAYDLTGSHAKVEHFRVSTHSGITSMIALNNAAGTDTLLIQVAGSTMTGWKQDGLANWTQVATTTFDQGAHRWWRIREASGTTFWEYSNNGVAWTTWFSEANPIPVTNLTAQLQLTIDGAASPPYEGEWAAFDNFNVAPRRRVIQAGGVVAVAA